MKMQAAKDKSKKFNVLKRQKSGGFKASKSSNNSGQLQNADPASEKLKKPPDQSPPTIIVDLPSADRTGVVEVEDDLIELLDDHDLHLDALDEEETLQDLLAAKVGSHEAKQMKMGSQVTAEMLKANRQEDPAEAKKWMEQQCFAKDHEENEEISADTAVSLGLYLPSALHRAREFLCKRWAASCIGCLSCLAWYDFIQRRDEKTQAVPLWDSLSTKCAGHNDPKWITVDNSSRLNTQLDQLVEVKGSCVGWILTPVFEVPMRRKSENYPKQHSE